MRHQLLKQFKEYQNFFEPGAFSDKQFCNNKKTVCIYFAIRLRMLFFLNDDVDIQLILEL